jgi:hypothetical protein
MTWPIAIKSAFRADVGRHAGPTVRHGCGSAQQLDTLVAHRDVDGGLGHECDTKA